MAKFNVLESNQAYMAWLGIYSYHLTEPSNEFFKSIVACFFMFNSSVMIIGSSILFIIKYISEVQAVLGAFKIAISGIQCGGMHFSVGIKMKLVKALHLKLQQIVDEGIDLYHFHKSIKSCHILSIFIIFIRISSEFFSILIQISLSISE